MRNSIYFRMGLNMLVHSKLRSWLTIIGIVIGVGSVIGIVSLGDSMQANVQSKLADMDLTKISITPGYSKASSNMPGPPGMGGSSTDATLTDKDMRALQGLESIQYKEGEISGSEKVKYLGQTATLSITGVDPQVWKYTTTLETSSGRLLEPADKYVAVIGSKVANEIFDHPVGINQVITINNKSVRVVGILKEEGMGADDSKIYMPIDGAVDLITDAKKDVYDSITVEAKSEDQVDGLMEDIKKRLMISRHINQEKDRDFTLSASKSMAESVTEMTGTMTLFLGAIAAVSLLVGSVGIANTMFTSVLEKTKEIGTMKAIGAKNRDILMIFLFNSGMVGLVGGILGVMLGAIVSAGLQTMMGGMTAGGGLSIVLMVEGLLLAVSIGVISGVVPAYRASKLKPVDALRYE